MRPGPNKKKRKLDPNPKPIASAVGFSVRDPKIFVFKARAVVSASGGATNFWRPNAIREHGIFLAAMPLVRSLIITG